MNELRLGLTIEALRLLMRGEAITLEFEDPELPLRVTLQTTEAAQQSLMEHIQRSLLLHLPTNSEMH